MQGPINSKKFRCPECNKSLQHHTAYAPWCVHCNWNVCPSLDQVQFKPHDSTSRIEPIFKQLDNQLLEAMVSRFRTQRKVRATSLRVAAVAVSIVSYLCSAALLYVGYRLQVSDLHLVLQLFGMLLIGVTLWALFPRFTADYSGGIVADPDEFPMLNHTVELIANALQVEVPRLVLTDQFDATFGRIGLRRQPVLVLGHPFLVLLEPQELVSLIAHEIAHDRDGTITRSMFVQTAYNAVNRWKRMLKPSNFYWRNIPLVPLMMAAAIAWIPIQLFSLFFNLIKQRESHHAEYEADRLSIFISGNGSAESLMRKSLYGHMVPLRQAYATASPDAKFNAISKSLETIPAKEFERLWRIADIIANRTANKTHPSFQNRLQFVNSFDEILPVVRLSKTQFASLQTELKRWPSVWSRHQSQGGNKPPSNPHNHGVVMASGD